MTTDVEMTDAEVRQQVQRTIRLIADFRELFAATIVDPDSPCAAAPTIAHRTIPTLVLLRKAFKEASRRRSSYCRAGTSLIKRSLGVARPEHLPEQRVDLIRRMRRSQF